jgi:hypothetical protein
MSGVFRNIDPPPLTARRVCTSRLWCGGEDTIARGRGGGGSIVRKTPDTALDSIYVSTFCCQLFLKLLRPNSRVLKKERACWGIFGIFFIDLEIKNCFESQYHCKI